MRECTHMPFACPLKGISEAVLSPLLKEKKVEKTHANRFAGL